MIMCHLIWLTYISPICKFQLFQFQSPNTDLLSEVVVMLHLTYTESFWIRTGRRMSILYRVSVDAMDTDMCNNSI